ncbi:MAG TPA: hypothetical protein VK435_02780, partial [Thermodesulfovibrionales bacterium]|nr:hypothetical protein [Thermodesulfovibrionales bacterium]
LTKLLHSASIILLGYLGIRMNMGMLYFAGILVTAILLAYENAIIKADDLSRLNMAFFTMNGVISVLMFGFVAAEVIFGRSAIV